MTMMTVMTMFLIYPFTLSHEHRHHRHHRHAYSEMTLAVYYCSKQKQWYYDKHKIRMTQMTLMTLNLGYGIGISSKQRHKRHLRHYRHTRAARGLGNTPEMCMWMTTCYASKTRLPLKRWQSNSMPIQIRIFPRVNRPLIHWKYLTCRSESMIDSLCPQKRNVAKIQPIAPEWISLDSSKILDTKKWISSDSFSQVLLLWFGISWIRYALWWR